MKDQSDVVAKVLAVVDTVVAAELGYNAVRGAYRISSHSQVQGEGEVIWIIVLLMYGIPALLAGWSALALWRSWRRKWLIQWTAGLTGFVVVAVMWFG